MRLTEMTFPVHSGVAAHRPSPETYRLITRPDALDDDQPKRLTQARVAKTTGPSLAQANVIRVLADLPRHRGCRELFTDPDEQSAISELLAARTLEEWDDTLAISDDAAFSVYERSQPSAFLTVMAHV